MPEAVVEVQDLSKRYRIGEQQEAYGTLRDAIASFVKSPLRHFGNGMRSSAAREIWALRHVCMEVRENEVLGIIGPNGAGKSTLLKILSRVTPPTEGVADIRGQVGSLLEVGMGFHPELTGRENIYLNGAILGMKKAEIQRRFDEIVDFAEIAEFLDTPVKRYSSGMYMRLAFSIAAHLEPEILIVDEVLAVGDATFQRKCLGKMGDEAKLGRTVLFVSHNMVALEGLCQRVVWLDKGHLVAEGSPLTIISRYLQSSMQGVTHQHWPDMGTAPGNDKVRLHRVSVRPKNGESSDPLNMRTPIVLEFEYWNLEPGGCLEMSFLLTNDHGNIVFESSPTDEVGWHRHPFPAALFRSECCIPGDLLLPGKYRVELNIVRDSAHIVYRHEDALVFEVQDSAELRGAWFGEYVGSVRPLLDWSTELIEITSLDALPPD